MRDSNALTDRLPTTSLTRTAPSPSAQVSCSANSASLRPPGSQALPKTDYTSISLSHAEPFRSSMALAILQFGQRPAPRVWPFTAASKASGLPPATLPHQRAFPRAQLTVPCADIACETPRASVRHHIAGMAFSQSDCKPCPPALTCAEAYSSLSLSA